MSGKPLTGWKVLFILIAFFGTIIGANIALAIAAVGSFPGIEVKNGYVASQRFEDERDAQMRLGWTASARYEPGRLHVTISDRMGDAAPLTDINLQIGRPTTEAQDLAPALAHDAEGFYADADLEPGRWRLDILAAGADGARFRQQLIIEVRG